MTGLREQKKAKTRLAMQQAAMRLFQKQGYADTTVEQIAAAAEVSPSTFFRYFPTKESVVLTDEYDDRMLESFRRQPASTGVLQAFRISIREVYDAMTPEEYASERERARLLTTVPSLRAASLQQMAAMMDLLAEEISRRNRKIGELELRVGIGAAIGAGMALMLASADRDDVDLADQMDKALDLLERGISV